jgi:hypothetical protein
MLDHPLQAGIMKRYEDKDFLYDPVSGILWHARSKGFSIRAGDRVTTKPASNGHLYTSVGGKKILQHTIAYKLVTGKMPTGVIIHKNNIKTDLRLDNLEHVSRSCLSRKYTKRSNRSKTNYRGVYYKTDKHKWVARIGAKGINLNLGTFNSLEEAVQARKNAEIKYDYAKER